MTSGTAPGSRPGSHSPFLVAAFLAAAVALLATAGTAHAATTTPATVTAAVHPVSTNPGGLLGPLTGTDQQGVPLSHYDISGNDENGWDVTSSIMLFLTNAFFTAARVLVGAQCWMLNWAFSFGPAAALLGPAGTIATAYQQHVIAPLGLAGAVLSFAAAWCGFMILRGRTSRGAGELAVSVLISALAGGLLASPATLLLGSGGLLGQVRGTAMSLASITATGGATDSQSPGQEAAPLTATLVETFVVEPYQLLNFGTLIGTPAVPASCQAAYTQIVQGGPWGDAGTPRNMMAGAGCQDLANYDANLTWDRLMGAILLLVAVLFVTVIVVLITGTLLIAQFALGLYTIMFPLVITAAVLPGAARGLLWRWTGGIAKVVLVIFAIIMFIPLFAVLIRGLLAGNASQPLAVRLFLLDVAAAGGLVFHRKLINASIRAGHRVGSRLERARIGGTHGAPSSGAASGALAPVSLADIHHGARAEISRITTPARRAGRRAHQAWAGKRQPPPEDAKGLQARMSATRGGRTLLRTAKAAAFAGKVAAGSTIGAPVAIPRAAKAVKTATRARGTAMKTRLAAAKARQGEAAKAFGKEWAANAGLTAAARAVKKGPLPKAVIAAAVHTAPAGTPRPRPGYSAQAPLKPGPAVPAPDPPRAPAKVPKQRQKPSVPSPAKPARTPGAGTRQPAGPPPVTPASAIRAAKNRPGPGSAGRPG